MTRPTNDARTRPRIGVTGVVTGPSAGSTGFDNDDAGLPGDPDTVQEAIEALAGRAFLPLTAVVDGVPELVWDEDDSLIAVEVDV